MEHWKACRLTPCLPSALYETSICNLLHIERQRQGSNVSRQTIHKCTRLAGESKLLQQADQEVEVLQERNSVAAIASLRPQDCGMACTMQMQ